MSRWCESILGVNVEAVKGKQVFLEWTETSGGLWNAGKALEFLSPFLWRVPPLEMRREGRERPVHLRVAREPLEMSLPLQCCLGS